MEIRQVNAKQGWQWIISGFYLFRLYPAAWIFLCFTLILIAMTLALVPLLGNFIFTLISPVFLAGLMIGCRDLEQSKKLDISHLFVGFKSYATPLITVGGIYLIGQVLIVGLVMLIGGTAMVDMLFYGKRVDESELMGVMGSILKASLIAIALSIPLIMAAWFAPLLVIFHHFSPVKAMQESFFACLKNMIPFQVYGITLVILGIIATMPYGLGLIILVPTIFASIYVSYKDIFLSEPLIIKENQLTNTMLQPNWSNGDVNTEKKEAWPSIEENTAHRKKDSAQCAYCGILFPIEKAIRNKSQYFCSNDHFEQYQSATEK